MSKELEALETIKNHWTIRDLLNESFKEEIDIIEAALKRLEEIDNSVKPDMEYYEKRSQALEIIKELVNSYEIDELPDSWFELLRTWLNKVLSKEKLELLKEVLL